MSKETFIVVSIDVYRQILMKLYVDPPGKPGEPECTATTEDSVTLAWDPPTKDGGKPIKGYILEKKEKGAKKWTRYIGLSVSK